MKNLRGIEMDITDDMIMSYNRIRVGSINQINTSREYFKFNISSTPTIGDSIWLPITEINITFESVIAAIIQLHKEAYRRASTVFLYCDSGRLISPLIHQLYWFYYTDKMYGGSLNSPYHECLNAMLIKPQLIEAIKEYRILVDKTTIISPIITTKKKFGI